MGKKKIMGWDRWGAHNHNFVERAEDLYGAARLGRYFQYVGAHSTFTPNMWRECHIFGRPADDIFEYHPKASVELETAFGAPGKEPPEVFFDFRDCFKEVTYESAPRAVVVEAFGRLVGLWIPERESLLLSDWSHNQKCVLWGAYLFPQLVEQLGITPLPPKKGRPKRPRVTITMGTDPEFELLCRGQVIPASREVCDPDFDKEIGVDGAGTQVELRPEPGSPREVVAALRKLINEFAREYKDFDLAPRGNRYPCGGHIHFGGLPAEFTPSKEALEILDDFLGRPTLDLSGEARGGYRRLSAWEGKRWGFEYRTPPAAVFANPKISRITLKLARNLMAAYLSRTVIEYDDPPSLEDYVRVGELSKKEAEYFLRFLRHPERRHIRAAWGAPAPPRQRTAAIITFRDEWDGAIQHALAHAIRERVRRGHMRRPKLILYGLRYDRGYVATIPITDTATPMGVLDDDPPYSEVDEDGQVWVGLPYIFRKAVTHVDIVEAVARAIVRHVRRLQRKGEV